MKKKFNSRLSDVFMHVYTSYKQVPGAWIGIISRLLDNFTSKCLLPIFFAKLVVFLAEYDRRNASQTVITILVLLLVTATVNSIGDYLFVKQTDRRYKKLAGEFHSKLLSKNVEYFEIENAGKLTGLFRDHLDGTIRVIRLLRGEVMAFLSALLLPVFALSFYNIKIALLVLAIGIVQLFFTNWTAAKVKQFRQGALNIYHKLSKEVADQIFNIAVVKASFREDFFNESVIELASQEEKLFATRHKVEAIYELLNALIVALGIFFTLWLIAEGNISIAIELAIIAILYLLQINLAISSFPDLFKKFHEHIERVFTTLPILTSKWENSDEGEMEFNPASSYDIVFQDVYYTYRYASGENSVRVFDKLNLTITNGTHYAVMSKSGTGKSTLAHLLLRFDDVTNGSILIGGSDIRKYRISALRRIISYVPPQPKLFNRTIRENILLYNPSATEEEMISASKCADAHEFISKLDLGYDTHFGGGGRNFSSGQIQRIAIARGLLKKDARIFIFDEITSALDPKAAHSIMDKIRKRLPNKTIIFMTHNNDLASKMAATILLDTQNPSSQMELGLY